MLDRILIRNFKRFEEVEIELGDAVLFVGPNNSGKTSALQALALWDLGLRRWHEKRSGKEATKRTGVAINRRDLVSIPVPEANLFWRDLRLRRQEMSNGQRRTENIRIEIEVRGIDDGRTWECGLEFDFANSESIYVRPLGLASSNGRSSNGRGSNGGSALPTVPEEALANRVAYLPPMSGLAANEVRLDPGAVQVRLGEGRTAEVLRNLCFQIHSESLEDWASLVSRVRRLFGVEILAPEYITGRGEIELRYLDHQGISLDLSASGRGLQQTLLLLAYLHLNPRSVLLLDEPDAHLEILRQRQIYQTLTELAREKECQLIAASHSEVLLNEAADRDIVVAFVGQPHRIDDRGTQVLKSLKSIGFESYYQAEHVGWVLYLEGSTDLAILRAFAETLGHEAAKLLDRPFVNYVENQLSKASDHFFGLREAKADLVALAILDRQDQALPSRGALQVRTWKRREIENYLCFPEVLEAFAAEEAERMRECIADQVPPAALRDREHSWWRDVKASDDFLNLVFESFYASRQLPNLMRKTDYHRLARFVPRESLDPEVVDMLDAIVEVAERAVPRGEP